MSLRPSAERATPRRSTAAGGAAARATAADDTTSDHTAARERAAGPHGAGPHLVVGLGNPGASYASHRHNVGAMVVQELARSVGATLRRHKAAQALVAQARLGSPGKPGARVVLAQPTTYMNDSGGPVAGLCRFFSLGAQQLVVIHDDLELAFGEVRWKAGGGEGGHNGLRSVSKSLKTREYARLRVGIGRPSGRTDPADYVLRPFSAAERKNLPFIFADALQTIEESLCAAGRSGA